MPGSLPNTATDPFRVASLDDIRGLIAEDMRAVDEVIRARLHSEVALIRQVADHIIGSGGKRLRPALLILAAGAFHYQGRKHHELAAVIEFIHTATLLHDDVVDASQLRRGQVTANALFGNPTSVLVGDFLYSRAFQMMLTVQNPRVMQELANATNVIAEGEVLQLLNCRNAAIDEQSYLRVIRFKTAKLFEAAMRLGAILGGATRDDEECVANYGMHLGTAFQLIDDVLDYSGDHVETGKNLGDDLAEGKPTLPLIYAMQHGTDSQATLVRRAIESSGRDDFKAVLAIIHETRALDYARAQALAESRAAASAIAGLSPTPYKDCLLQLADFAVTRSH